MDAVADEASHRNASMLDFGVTEKANGRFVRLLPELPFREVEGIEEPNRRVQPFRQSLQICLESKDSGAMPCNKPHRKLRKQPFSPASCAANLPWSRHRPLPTYVVNSFIHDLIKYIHRMNLIHPFRSKSLSGPLWAISTLIAMVQCSSKAIAEIFKLNPSMHIRKSETP